MTKRVYAGAATSLSDFKQLAALGEGAYSVVYKVIRLADNEIYALKKVKLPSLSDKEKQNALNEVRLLASVEHENVISYKDAFFDDKSKCLCIVTEMADAGDLYQQIVKCTKERTHIREPDVWRWLIGMARGLKALHDLKILHRDLKCANIFLHGKENPVAKLGDFNVSKVAKRGLCMTQTGTPYYASPEVWRDMPYDGKSDMWSLGCVLYEVMALKPPFRAEDMEGLYKKVLKGQYPPLPRLYTADLHAVIAALLQVNPLNRPTVDQLLEMPAVQRHTSAVGGHSTPTSGGFQSDLLSTIKLPKNASELAGCLPKSRYNLPKVVLQEDESVASRDSGGRHEKPRERASQHHHRVGELEPSQVDRVPDSLDTYIRQGHARIRPAPESAAAPSDRLGDQRSDRPGDRPADRLPPPVCGGQQPLPLRPLQALHQREPPPGSNQRQPRSMANYARQQYSVNEKVTHPGLQPRDAQSQEQPTPNAFGGIGSLRLPRIHSKA